MARRALSTLAEATPDRDGSAVRCTSIGSMSFLAARVVLRLLRSEVLPAVTTHLLGHPRDVGLEPVRHCSPARHRLGKVLAQLIHAFPGHRGHRQDLGFDQPLVVQDAAQVTNA